MSSLFLSTVLTNPSGHSWWYVLRFFFFFFYSGFSFDLHSGRVKNESRIFWFLVSYSFGLTSCGHATTDVLKKMCEQSHRKCGVRETVLEILMILDTRTEAERRSQALWGRRQDWTMGENYGLAKKYAWIKTEPELDQLNQVKNTVSPELPRHFYLHSLNGRLWELFPKVCAKYLWFFFY